LLFGGVYSNLQALQTIAEIASKENIEPENCISTSDIVGYCAQPEETVQFFKNWKQKKNIAGNVEIQLNDTDGVDVILQKVPDATIFSQLWYPYSKSKLNQNF
jgi:hypothetical protein